MTDPATLTTLIDLARQAVDDAARQLRALADARQEADGQLNTLQDYRQDYLQRLNQATQAGLSASNYHNFQQFIATLDQAISQQNKHVSQLDARIELGRAEWRQCQRKLSSFEALQARDERVRAERETRREQRLNDEISAALYRRARRPHA